LPKRYIVAITGASGAIIGLRLIEFLLRLGADVAATVSEGGYLNIRLEVLGLTHEEAKRGGALDLRRVFDFLKSTVDTSRLEEYGQSDWFAPGASGTGSFEAVVVAPCSMKTLSAVAAGYGDTLITRSVDVALKEGRRAILVPRETPLGLIHIENMLRAKRAGCDILPPVLEFYTHPQTIDDLVNFTVGRILNLLNIKHNLFTQWGGL
jgi:4-hydroxy-3-polyprenylbenzoate decarboxylase